MHLSTSAQLLMRLGPFVEDKQPNKLVSPTAMQSNQSAIFLVGNRFQVTLRILSPGIRFYLNKISGLRMRRFT